MRAKILNASAGSGKTYQLAYKYVHDVIERPESYSAILAVTFTNKATEEMKTRILKEINTLASGQRSGYMSLLRRARRGSTRPKSAAAPARPARAFCTTIRVLRYSRSTAFSNASCGPSSRSWAST